MNHFDDYHLWVSQLGDVEAEDAKEHEQASARCFFVHERGGYGKNFPMTVPVQGYDDRRQFTHALLPYKTPHYDHEKQREAEHLNSRLAISTIRMLACSFKPEVMKDICRHFRCIGCFKSADPHRYGPNDFNHIYVNVGTALYTTALYAGIVTKQRVDSELPTMAQSPDLERVSEKEL